MTKNIYRIRVQFVGQATERSLPYEITKKEDADQVAHDLNEILQPLGYKHYVTSSEPTIFRENKRKTVTVR